MPSNTISRDIEISNYVGEELNKHLILLRVFYDYNSWSVTFFKKNVRAARASLLVANKESNDT